MGGETTAARLQPRAQSTGYSSDSGKRAPARSQAGGPGRSTLCPVPVLLAHGPGRLCPLDASGIGSTRIASEELSSPRGLVTHGALSSCPLPSSALWPTSVTAELSWRTESSVSNGLWRFLGVQGPRTRLLSAAMSCWGPVGRPRWGRTWGSVDQAVTVSLILPEHSLLAPELPRVSGAPPPRH